MGGEKTERNLYDVQIDGSDCAANHSRGFADNNQPEAMHRSSPLASLQGFSCP